ncbi:histidine phosphatase family protein [Pseudomonas sp. NPDC089734]|uniref:lipopolysaccharide core heptose(II)-phosphate phosphatase PmrG n=1 Tax=Pseudomonas sp. NPDC089734 TaxID=3364469 RepID=UPI0037FC8F08
MAVTSHAGYRSIVRAPRVLLLLPLLLAPFWLGTCLLAPSGPLDLSQSHNLRKANILAHWAEGDLVVLVRHAERCDHSTNPCLGPSDGITRKGQGMALQLGNAFRALGLDKTDIFNSPLMRTAQTAHFAFNDASLDQDWLANCRHSLLDDIEQHKVAQRNMVLITHSECFNELEKSLKVSARTVPDYGSALFVAVNKDNHSPRILGFLDAQDWKAVIPQQP